MANFGPADYERCACDSNEIKKRALRSGLEAASSMPRAMTLQLGAALLKDQALPF